MEIAEDLMGFIDHMDSQFRTMCGDKTSYELDGKTHYVDCRYQALKELECAILKKLEPKVNKIVSEFVSTLAAAA